MVRILRTRARRFVLQTSGLREVPRALLASPQQTEEWSTEPTTPQVPVAVFTYAADSEQAIMRTTKLLTAEPDPMSEVLVTWDSRFAPEKAGTPLAVHVRAINGGFLASVDTELTFIQDGDNFCGRHQELHAFGSLAELQEFLRVVLEA